MITLEMLQAQNRAARTANAAQMAFAKAKNKEQKMLRGFSPDDAAIFRLEGAMLKWPNAAERMAISDLIHYISTGRSSAQFAREIRDMSPYRFKTLCRKVCECNSTTDENIRVAKEYVLK